MKANSGVVLIERRLQVLIRSFPSRALCKLTVLKDGPNNKPPPPPCAMFPVNRAYNGVLCVDAAVFHAQVFKRLGSQGFAGVIISNPGR